MKKSYTGRTGIIFILLLSFGLIYAIPSAYTQESLVSHQDISALPFKNGESLTYEVRYKGLKIGESILKFHGEEELGGKKVYHVTFSTSVPAFKDTEELYAEKDSFLPIEVRRKIKKRIGFGDNIKEVYDQRNYRVDISQRSKLRSKDFFIKKDSSIHNAILLTYFYRMLERFDKNDKFKIRLPTIDLEVMFKGIETVETPLGDFQAYAFISKPPKFKLWLSADERRIPLKIYNPGTLGYSLVIKSIDTNF